MINKAGKAKYPGLHSLRHFYASWCINRRVDGGLELPLKLVQSRLGHASIQMTADRYGHQKNTNTLSRARKFAHLIVGEIRRSGLTRQFGRKSATNHRERCDGSQRSEYRTKRPSDTGPIALIRYWAPIFWNRRQIVRKPQAARLANLTPFGLLGAMDWFTIEA